MDAFFPVACATAITDQISRDWADERRPFKVWSLQQKATNQPKHEPGHRTEGGRHCRSRWV